MPFPFTVPRNKPSTQNRPRPSRTALFSWCLGVLVVQSLFAPVTAHADDSQWLYGIHWYGDPNTSTVETMTGNKGIWTLEIVIPYSDTWWQASGQLWKFQQIAARGHTIILRIQPNWGVTASNANYPLADYLLKIQQTAETLKDVCHVWQIGNEMNLYGEYDGQELTAADYITEFKQVRDTIKSVASPLGEQIVLVGPVSPGAVAPGVRHTDGNVYLGQMCDELTDDDFDGFAIHAYGAPWYNAAAARNDLKSGYTSQLAVIDSKGFANKPVHITEWNRRVEAPTEYNEGQSAQFIYGAFADLHAWNQTTGAHPISSACWFIYQYDSGTWNQYSIEYLHTVGPSGPNNDLWDAFQYACTQDYPTAYPQGSSTAPMYDDMPPGTNIAASAATVTADSSHDTNSTPDNAIDGVISAGSKWASAGTAPPHWLQLDFDSPRHLSGLVVRHAGAGGEAAYYNTAAFQLQTADSASGPWDIDAAIFNPAQAAVTTRAYYAPRITQHVRLHITDPGIDNWARIPEFEVYEITPGDMDYDGDIDLIDFAGLQNCFTGTDEPQQSSACFPAHFDEDGDVDLNDLAGFVDHLTGP